MLQIHEKIERARVSAGLTQDEMASKLNIKRSTYQYWEKKTPAIDKIKQVSEVLGLPDDYFFGENDEKNVPRETGVAKETPPTNDKYIQLMEKMIANLEKDKAWMQTVIDSSLIGLSDTAKTALAYQKAWVEYISERDAGQNPKRKKEIRANLDRLIASKLGIGDEMGIATDERN